MKTTETRIQELVTDWITNPRWNGIERPYTAEEVVKLQGSYQIEHSVARIELIPCGATKFSGFCSWTWRTNWKPSHSRSRSRIRRYLSGWQVAADANVAGKCTLTNLYILNSVPLVVNELTMHFTCRPNTGSKRNYRQKKTTYLLLPMPRQVLVET
jgi:isocitrate lyase